jgi:hypothetical protein
MTACSRPAPAGRSIRRRAARLERRRADCRSCAASIARGAGCAGIRGANAIATVCLSTGVQPGTAASGRRRAVLRPRASVVAAPPGIQARAAHPDRLLQGRQHLPGGRPATQDDHHLRTRALSDPTGQQRRPARRPDTRRRIAPTMLQKPIDSSTRRASKAEGFLLAWARSIAHSPVHTGLGFRSNPKP